MGDDRTNALRVAMLPDDLGRKVAAAGDLIVFDGECMLCAGFFRFMLRHDRARRFSFVLAQSPLGLALYDALGLDSRNYETNLVVVNGAIYAKGAAFIAAMRAIGWPWRAAAVLRIVSAALADPVYDAIARNRYRVFGRHETCILPDADVRARFVTPGGDRAA